MSNTHIAKLENNSIVRKVKSFFLGEKNMTPEQRKKIIKNFNKIEKKLLSLNIEYNQINLLDVVKHRVFGYDINLGTVIKVVTLEKQFKRRVFLLFYLIRIFYYYKILNLFEKKDYYEINLIDYEKVHEKKKGKKIETAFVCTDPSYFKTFLNIFDELESKKKDFLIIVPLKAKNWGFLEKLSANKYAKIVFIEEFFNEKIKRLFGKNLKRNLYQKNKNKIQKSLTLKKTNLLNYSFPAIKTVFSRYLPQIQAYIDIANEIYDIYQPKALVGAKVRRYAENSFFHTAKKRGIKTISIMPVLMTKDLTGYYDQGNFKIPDNIIVWNQEQKKIVEERSTKKSKIFIYGNPQWDNILNTKQNAKEILGIKSKFVVIATQPLWLLKDVEEIAESCHSLGFKVIIKPHPREDADPYKKIKNARLVTDKKIDLYSLLKQADIVFTAWSTVGLESLILGTPVVIYITVRRSEDPSVKEAIEMYQNMNVPILNSKKQLNKTLQRFANTDKKENHKKYNTGFKVEKESITKKIVKLLQN